MGWQAWMNQQDEVVFTSSFHRNINFRKTREQRTCKKCSTKILIGKYYCGTTWQPICHKCAKKFYNSIIKSFCDHIVSVENCLRQCESVDLKQIEVKKEIYV